MQDQPVNGADVIPPNAMCCYNCGHSLLIRLPPPNIGQHRLCKFLPPTPIALRDQRGTITGFKGANPVVDDKDFCAQFQTTAGESIPQSIRQVIADNTGNATKSTPKK